MFRPIRAGSARFPRFRLLFTSNSHHTVHARAQGGLPCSDMPNAFASSPRYLAPLPRSHYPGPASSLPLPRPRFLAPQLLSSFAPSLRRCFAPPLSSPFSLSLVCPSAALLLNVFNYYSLRSTRAALASAGFVGRHFSLHLLAPLVSSASALCARFTRVRSSFSLAVHGAAGADERAVPVVRTVLWQSGLSRE